MPTREEEQQRLIALAKEYNAERGRTVEIEDDILIALGEQIDRQQSRFENLKAQGKALETQLGVYEKLSASDDKRVLLAQTSRDLAKNKLDIAKQLLVAGTDDIKDREEAYNIAVKDLETAEKKLEVTKGTTDAIKQGTAAAQQLGTAMASAFGQYGEHPFFNAKTIGNLIKVGRGLYDKSLKPLNTLIGSMAGGSLVALTNSFFNLIFELDQTQRSFIRATGAGEEYADSIKEVYEETRVLGVDMKEAAASMQALYTTYTDFTMLSKAQRDELVTTGATLAEQGVANEDFARSMQLQTKILGESVSSARANSLELADLARIIGVTPQQMGRDFAEAGAGIAKLGTHGVRAFKDLAIVSKSTGLEISKLLAITDKFDTFEGAATQAGKLNAALGGNFVNAMDLMTATDPVERFSMIRDAILDTGLTFDDMSYYQRVFYKDALGLNDVSDLALMLSGDMSTLAGATQKTSAEYKTAAEEAKRVQSITEQFKAAMVDLIPVASDLLTEFRDYTKTLTEGSPARKELQSFIGNLGTALKWVARTMILVAKNWKIAAGVLAGVWIGAALLKWWALRKFLEDFMGKTILKLSEGAGSALEKLGESGGEAIDDVGKAATKNAVGIGALSLSIVAIGAAVAGAALGLAELVKAFGAAGDNAGPAVLSINMLLGAFIGMMALLIPLAPVAGAAGTALMPLAAVILAIGAAVGIAAAGIGLMAYGLTEMFKAMDVPKMLAFTAFVAVAGTIGLLLIPAALGLSMFTGAMFAFGLQLRLFPTDELAPMTAFLASLGLAGAVATDLHKVALAIGEINNKLREMPKENHAEFTTTMHAVTTAAVAATTAQAAARTQVSSPAASTPANERPYAVKVELTLDGDIISEKQLTFLAGRLMEGAIG